jgi:hypothetical protein
MSRAYDLRAYNPSSFDDYFCLKPPLLLWLAALYLSRAITIPVAMEIGSFTGISNDATGLLRGLTRINEVFPSILAAVILYTLCRRVPSASLAVRWIWAHGRIFIAAAAILDIAVTAASLDLQSVLNGQAVWPVVSVGLNLFFLGYVLAARRVRDAFSDFPPPLHAGNK